MSKTMLRIREVILSSINKPIVSLTQYLYKPNMISFTDLYHVKIN